jgi:hypothetical protein
VAGVIQPTLTLQAGEVETEHILAAVDGPRRTVTFRLRVYIATELARPLEDVSFAEIECFGDLDGGSSRVRAGSLCEPESRSHDGPSPPTATASRWTCGLVRSTNAWKSTLSRCRFRQAAVTETSVHNAVQPVAHASGDVVR